MECRVFLAFLVSFTVFVRNAFGVCFFPSEYQGIFSSQIEYNTKGVFSYSQITILPDAIPIWGVCHLREENIVILSDSTGGQDCMRCFHLYLRSPNVIQVYTEGLDRCYDNEHSAIASCPTLADIQARKAREIVLYKSRSFRQDGKISKVMCPFVGRYHFSYSVYDGRRRTDTCIDMSSQVTSCPKASQLKFYFRDCTFGSLDLRLECLGSWTGFDDHKYLALFDPDASGTSQPKYRCGMFVEDTKGSVSLSLSVDSSCHRQLISPWQGFESLSLTPVRAPAPPAAIYSSCVFPQWAQGAWQDIQISGNRFVYRDEEKDFSHTGTCIQADRETKEERFVVYTLTQCGIENFSCLWLKRRSDDVIEFILAPGMETFNASSLCTEDAFWKHAWMTQGRETERSSSSVCPLNGEYFGVLPDDSSLCAKLSSDCSNLHQMEYIVSPCANSTIAYEERYYECLGRWEEAGVTYTYTWRRDVDKYECFAGVEVSEDEVYIIEAGSSCRRGLQPLAKGMKIIRKDKCVHFSNAIIDISNSIDVEARADRRRGRKTTPWREGKAEFIKSAGSARHESDKTSYSLIIFITCLKFVFGS